MFLISAQQMNAISEHAMNAPTRVGMPIVDILRAVAQAGEIPAPAQEPNPADNPKPKLEVAKEAPEPIAD